MKRSKIALAITLSVSALFLTACNDNNDDYTGIDSNKTFLSESNYAIDKVDNASSIKVMTYNMTNVQGKQLLLLLWYCSQKHRNLKMVIEWLYGSMEL